MVKKTLAVLPFLLLPCIEARLSSSLHHQPDPDSSNSNARAITTAIKEETQRHLLDGDPPSTTYNSTYPPQQQQQVQQSSVAAVPSILSSYDYYTRPFQHFSKIKFDQDPSLSGQYLPLEQYPLSATVQHALATLTTAHSPMTRANMPSGTSAAADAPNREIWDLGGWPSFPGSDSFWTDLRTTVQWQMLRRSNGPVPFTLPDLWSGYNISQVSEAVHGEYPGFWQAELLKSLWKQKLAVDYNVMPFLSRVDFVGTTVRLAELNTWAISAVCPMNFLVKWFVGRLRPEEIAFQIARGLRTDAPSDLQASIDMMNLQTPEEFTGYPEGCPSHPSFPAMHGAASAMSMWLAVVADLTSEQYCQLLRMDYAVSFARTVAGMHYPTDNLAGLNLGQHLVALVLPQHLATEYGANLTAAQAKVDRFRFHWDSFNPVTCSVKYLYN
jgi:membrane-associated phospholipid phosphatase